MDEYEESSILIPIINDELTVMSFVVPKNFMYMVESEANKVIESFEKHPACADMDENNKMVQALSFMIQSAFDYYIRNDAVPDIDIDIDE